MGKKTKVGKQRQDKFYKLAKETGFRSRASFKLIQLNRKHEFLPKARVVIDLCAAPGGWLQVAQQAMPVSSVIIGVDLVPIRTIRNVITIQEDITTSKCIQTLKKQLSGWKADVVLHDGAPNLGKSWIQDAYSQNELTLSALKVATQLLHKGGWFVTKVFRSKDYLSLVWVFKKLFKQVHVTKPAASRSESAEIFAVCQGYLAPDRIDESFLDPGKVFKDVVNIAESKKNILHITGKKPKAEGYEETPVHSIMKASDFILSDNHMERLGKCTRIELDDDDFKNHKLTTSEVIECCKDIKVLGKADLKLLLSWRKQLREIIDTPEKTERKDFEPEVTESVENEKDLDGAIKEAEELELSKLQDAKRKKKKILKERKKLHERLNLKMIIKDDEPIIDEDRELFKLAQIKDPKDLTKVEDDDNLEFEIEGKSREIEDILQPSYKKNYASYNRHVKEDSIIEADPEKSESDNSSDEGLSSDLEFESEPEDVEKDLETTETILKGKQNPLMVDLVERPDRVNDTVEKWYDREEFADAEMDSDLELDLLAEETNKDDVEMETEETITPKTKNASKEKTKAKQKKKKIKLDPEGLALGSLIVQSKKMKRDIIENGYNRFASNDENLPAWFVQDEKKHYRKQMPVTAELVAEYKQRLREINARPIKKVIEAKARKKRRAIRRMEKAKKRAEKVTEHPDMSVSEKADELRTIYKKAMPKENRDVKYIVAKKGIGRRVSRPAGVKGRFKVVDPRMRKDADRRKGKDKRGKDKKRPRKKK